MYQVNNNQPSNFISQDTSNEQRKIKSLFEQGDFHYNTGTDIDAKKQGLQEIMQGLQLLRIVIDRTHDSTMKGTFQKIYDQRLDELDKKTQTLQKAKQQPIAIKEGGGGNSGGNDGKGDENDKFKQMMQEAIVQEKPNVKWDDIAGLKAAKEALKEAVIMPIKFPQIFVGLMKPWKGILLYGPPGTGKTFLAKACATEAQATFFSISAADIVSKYVGEAEKTIKALFNLAREKKPSIIFIDECDSMFGARGDGQQESSRRAITEFLTQMQGVGRDDQGVLVLGATNLPWALDAAVRRRFEKRIYIPLPEIEARYYMIKNALKSTPNTLKDEDIQRFAQQCDGYSGSDISILLKDAALQPIRLLQKTNKFKQIFNKEKNMQQFYPVSPESSGPDIVIKNYMDLEQNQLFVPPISVNDFNDSLKKSKPSVNKDQLQEYVNFTQTFGQDG